MLCVLKKEFLETLVLVSKMAKSIWYIYGAGGLGLETFDILKEMLAAENNARYEIKFLVDNACKKHIRDIEVVDFINSIEGSKVTIAVGEPELRRLMYSKILDKGLILSSALSPKAFIAPTAKVGEGTIVAPFASVQSDSFIGKNVSVNTQAIIGHHAEVSDGAVISSQVNLGGSCFVGKYSYVGMGALILEGLSIGNCSIIGMGSVVYKDVPDDVVALGNPARVAKKNEDKKVFKRSLP